MPTAEDEAIRDLIRCRDDIRRFERKARQRLLAFLLRHGYQYSGKRHWTKGFYNWLATIKFPHPAQQIALQEYIDTVNECSQRVKRVTQQIQAHVEQWSRAPFVKAYQALRGVSLIVSATVVAEIGDMNRFPNPKQLMAYLGLIPSEHSSGKKVRRGSITKTGNSHVRRVLVEAGWSYRMPARKSIILLKGQQGLPKNVADTNYILKPLWRQFIRLSISMLPIRSGTSVISCKCRITRPNRPFLPGRSQVVWQIYRRERSYRFQ